MKFLFALIAILAVTATVFGRKLNRCSLAKELHSLGVPKSELPQWTCLAEHESSYRTHIIGPPNTDGSQDYGIFQINSKYWCRSPKVFSYNGCHVDCNVLLGDNLKPALDCARLVKGKQGWKAWAAWKFCNGRLPSIDNCF